MLPRKRYRTLLLRFLERTQRAGWGTLLWFSVAASVSLPLRAQQANTGPCPACSGALVLKTQLNVVNSDTPQEDTSLENPTLALQTTWVMTTDSVGDVRQNIKLQSDFAISDHGRAGLLLSEGLISNAQSFPAIPSEQIRSLGITGQWLPSNTLKLEGMFGVSQVGASVNGDGQSVGQALIPVTNLQLHLTPSKIVKLDFGFERSVFDLSPLIVSNRVIRNQFVVRPELKLRDGWRLRALAEMGPMTSLGESNARYNSEFTVGHKIGKASELYSTYSMLHYAQSTTAGYFSPDSVQDMEGGWSTDLDRSAFSFSFDLALGAGHAKEHGAETFGPWGLSGHTGAYLTWTVRDGLEVDASYEYEYDQSSPPVQPSTAEAWHMNIVTLSLRWGTQSHRTQVQGRYLKSRSFEGLPESIGTIKQPGNLCGDVSLGRTLPVPPSVLGKEFRVKTTAPNQMWQSLYITRSYSLLKPSACRRIPPCLPELDFTTQPEIGSPPRAVDYRPDARTGR